LIVDDYPDGAEMLAEAVELMGYQTATAEDAETAIVEAERLAPRVVLVDVGLPGMNGIELSRRLNESKRSELTLIVISGFTSSQIKEEAASAGVHHYLVKPLNFEHLKTLLQTIFDGSSSSASGGDSD
jgi:two-component system CheB/CheR fusion protein